MIKWEEHNEHQVKRYEFHISKEMVDEWKNEPINMNNGSITGRFLKVEYFEFHYLK